MNYVTNTQSTSTNKNKTFSNLTTKALRLFILLVLIPLFNLSLSSCSQSDSIAPESENHSAARENASILNVDGFESDKVGSFWSKELFTPTAGKLVNDLHRVGNQAMRFSWKPSQANGTNKMLHSELATSAIAPGDVAERWYGYSSYMPSASMAKDDQTVIVSQWHGVPDPGFEDSVPPLCIELNSDRLKLWYCASNVAITKALQNSTSNKRLDLGAAIYDRWVDYVVHVKWDPTGKTGLLEIWQDGKRIVNEQGISIGYPQQRKPYWKCGLYCWMAKATYEEKSIYYDEVRIGGPSANYDAVKPGRNDNSAKVQF
ncbi:hypothetical protein G8759_19750 [Spirosoma aureum]|uniref:Polysaccharide lyase n=1 Tax=Spirosoma aureum TaxID=2692134 RepID=A0A6G9AQY0_9BACT|nr:polysaccharide lyase [Spirosoma aureum]QIP14685.1 hypothetical protein G8759_19750 [Spirosoma aureum]